MANATSGWMPTITVSAPRSRAISAMVRSVREPKESRTSRAATSMMTPRARCWPIWSMRSSLEPHHLRVVQGSVDRRDQVRPLSQDRDERRSWSSLVRSAPSCSGDRVAEQPLGLLEAALQVTDGVHLAQVDPDRHQRLGDRRGQPGDDDAGAHQP